MKALFVGKKLHTPKVPSLTYIVLMQPVHCKGSNFQCSSAGPWILHDLVLKTRCSSLCSVCREAWTNGVQLRFSVGQQTQASPHMLTLLLTRVAWCASSCISKKLLCLC